jgi:hypothetical protein
MASASHQCTEKVIPGSRARELRNPRRASSGHMGTTRIATCACIIGELARKYQINMFWCLAVSLRSFAASLTDLLPTSYHSSASLYPLPRYRATTSP